MKKRLIVTAFALMLMGSAGAALAARCTQTSPDGTKIVVEGETCAVINGNCSCTG